MNTKLIYSLCVASILSFLFVVGASAQEKKPEIKVSEEEAKALNAINAMTDPAAKLKAVEDFIKKFPKTPVRVQLAETVAGEIAKIKDITQAISLAETARTIFTADEELEPIRGVLLDSFVQASRADDVYKIGGEILAKNPDEVHTHVQLAFTAANEVKKQNQKFVQQGLQSGLKAIELIEADKKPPKMDPTNWASHKQLLPSIYQQVAVLNLVTGNAAEAKTKAAKAAELGPTDPMSFALLGMVINSDYLKLATSYKAMPEGKDKEATLKKIEGMMDEIIDAYAHAVALSIGKPEHQAMMQQLTVDLTSYYKFRHNQSTDGLQALIDKYKAKP
jgi:cell division ATPase FtsA